MPVSTVGALAVAQHMRDLIIKPQEMHIFGAPMSSSIPAAITSGAGALLSELPNGYFDFGLIDADDAVSWSREIEKATVNAVGYRDPVRSDITSDMTNLSVKFLETNRYTLEQQMGVDLSGIVPDATTGEVVITQALSLKDRPMRYFGLIRDGAGVDTVYIARILAAGVLGEFGEQAWTDREGSLAYSTTINSTVDTDAGFSVRHYFGGPGWRTLLGDNGFPVLTP